MTVTFIMGFIFFIQVHPDTQAYSKFLFDRSLTKMISDMNYIRVIWMTNIFSHSRMYKYNDMIQISRDFFNPKQGVKIPQHR